LKLLRASIEKDKDDKMVDYKIVKYCRRCKKRYVVNKGEANKNFCDECQVIMDNQKYEV